MNDGPYDDRPQQVSDMTDAPPPRRAGAEDNHDALRADIYRLLARLVREPPSPDLLAWLAALDADPDGSRLSGCWDALIQSAGRIEPEEQARQLTRAHFRHLVGVIEGEITPYASWYRQGHLMDDPLLALRRDLRRLGIARTEDCRDPEDHLAALCEVMAMLLEDDGRDEAARFFMAHLAPWAKRCFEDLAGVDTPFYSRVGTLGSAFITEEHRHQQAEASRQPVRLVPTEENSLRADST